MQYTIAWRPGRHTPNGLITSCSRDSRRAGGAHYRSMPRQPWCASVRLHPIELGSDSPPRCAPRSRRDSAIVSLARPDVALASGPGPQYWRRGSQRVIPRPIPPKKAENKARYDEERLDNYYKRDFRINRSWRRGAGGAVTRGTEFEYMRAQAPNTAGPRRPVRSEVGQIRTRKARCLTRRPQHRFRGSFPGRDGAARERGAGGRRGRRRVRRTWTR